MTPNQYYRLSVREWKRNKSNWFKNVDMRRHNKSQRFGFPGRICGYVEAAEKVLEDKGKLEVWKIDGRNWTLKPGSESSFLKSKPDAKRRKRPICK